MNKRQLGQWRRKGWANVEAKLETEIWEQLRRNPTFRYAVSKLDEPTAERSMCCGRGGSKRAGEP